jgi:hypothetical protein
MGVSPVGQFELRRRAIQLATALALPLEELIT